MDRHHNQAYPPCVVLSSLARGFGAVRTAVNGSARHSPVTISAKVVLARRILLLLLSQRHRRHGHPRPQTPAVRPDQSRAVAQRRAPIVPVAPGQMRGVPPLVAENAITVPALLSVPPLDRRPFDYSDLAQWIIQIVRHARRALLVLSRV